MHELQQREIFGLNRRHGMLHLFWWHVFGGWGDGLLKLCGGPVRNLKLLHLPLGDVLGVKSSELCLVQCGNIFRNFGFVKCLNNAC